MRLTLGERGFGIGLDRFERLGKMGLGAIRYGIVIVVWVWIRQPSRVCGLMR